jgi:hypothetical protein
MESSEADRMVKRKPRSLEEIARQREREDLLLSRTRLITRIQSSPNARYTEMLQKALAEVEGKLSRI